jgi:2-(1,2-epoxy-1,2-dihydrophenyl)acetyl-CoA isomerase
MGYETILFDRDGAVATITLNRPKAMNSITWELTTELGEALAVCENTTDIRAVILIGSGRSFCAGADISVLPTRTGNAAVRYLYDLADGMHERVIIPIRRMGKPVIGAVNGVAAGGGLGLALACDLRVTTEEARFLMAYTSMGICPDCSVSFFLPRLVGTAKAMELYLFNEPLSGRQAHDTGLVNRVVPEAELLPMVQEMAGQLAQGPTAAYGQTKHLLNRSFSNDLATHLREEALGVGNCAASDDHLEGVAAFLAKRKPCFKGH